MESSRSMKQSGARSSHGVHGLRRAVVTLALALLAVDLVAPASSGAVACRAGGFALSDAQDEAGVRGAIERACPCVSFDGSASNKEHSSYLGCAKAVITDAADGTPVLGAFSLRRECRRELAHFVATSTCGHPANSRVVCCELSPSTGRARSRIRRPSRCVSSAQRIRNACFASSFTDVCSGDGTTACRTQVVQETVDLPTAAQPAHTPGTPGVVVTNPKLLTQFGGPAFSLNRARYTRWRLAGPEVQPDAILILVPGFEGG